MNARAGVLVLFLLLAQACGSPTTSSPRETLPVAPTKSVKEVAPDAHLVGLVPIPWQRAQKVAGGHRLRIFFFGGASRCGGLKKVQVRYRTRAVRVTLFQGHDPGSSYCPVSMIREKRVIVRLRHPLGHRPLVDGAG